MVEVKNISFAYNKVSRKILDDISFAIENNQCIAILGNNGVGKSTLIKCIDRICPVKKGAVIVDGKNVFNMTKNMLAQNIAYVPQTSTSLSMTVFDLVLLGRKPYIKWDATSNDRQVVSDIIKKMKLDDFAMRDVSELSGGEIQKVMLARALAQEPKLLLLDEPTSNLDLRNQHEVLQIIKKISREHDTCLAIVIHDLNLAVRYCDYLIFLKDSRIFASGGPEIMTPENIEKVYGIKVNIIKHMGYPVIVPIPDIKTAISSFRKK